MSDEKILTKLDETFFTLDPQIEFSKFNENFFYDCVPESVRDFEFHLPEINNPVVEELQTLRDETTKQTKELQNIRYENMKLNAQIDTLNKTIDSKNDELENLRNINTELKIANKTLEESNNSNRGYWIKTIFVGIFTTILGFVLGKYF